MQKSKKVIGIKRYDPISWLNIFQFRVRCFLFYRDETVFRYIHKTLACQIILRYTELFIFATSVFFGEILMKTAIMEIQATAKCTQYKYASTQKTKLAINIRKFFISCIEAEIAIDVSCSLCVKVSQMVLASGKGATGYFPDNKDCRIDVH